MRGYSESTRGRNRRVARSLVLTAVIFAMVFSMAGCGVLPGLGNSPEPVEYTVTFDLNGGTLISGDLVQTVAEGGSAVAPQAENGIMSLSWDKTFTDVDSDITVRAMWEKTELSSTDIAEIVQAATVSVNCEYYNGNTSSGTGFFIDDQGTIVTCYHVIEYAVAIDVEIPGGGKHDVTTIVAFDELYDLAILKIDLPGTPGLTISETPPKVGESVYANGSALGTLDGTFTSGSVSSVSREVGSISCIQMDAAISPGNSGGPLVNSYAEVVGVNAMSYTAGESLNLAIKIENLDKLTNKVNYKPKDYEEWIMKEADRSYAPLDYEGTAYYSTVNTYTTVTGAYCIGSVDWEDNYYNGYVEECSCYIYDYDDATVDRYVEYLKTKGFAFSEREDFNNGVSYYYINEWSGMLVDMFHNEAEDELWIWVEK